MVALEAQAAGLPCILSDRVPDSAVIGKNVEKLDLCEMHRWVDACLAFENVKPVDNTEAIRAGGYDIKATSDEIRKLYLS